MQARRIYPGINHSSPATAKPAHTSPTAILEHQTHFARRSKREIENDKREAGLHKIKRCRRLTSSIQNKLGRSARSTNHGVAGKPSWLELPWRPELDRAPHASSGITPNMHTTFIPRPATFPSSECSIVRPAKVPLLPNLQFAQTTAETILSVRTFGSTYPASQGLSSTTSPPLPVPSSP